MINNNMWPSLPWSEWRDTATTVHLFTQIIGKIRLGLMPMQSEWAQVPLTVTSRGLTSAGMPTDFGSLDISFDFISHSINFYASNGRQISFPLRKHSVAEFYSDVLLALNELHVIVHINPMSVEMRNPVRMDTDKEHNTYDADAVHRWWLLLVSINNVFNVFRSGFSGKQTPVSFYWGSFDLAVTRFSDKIVEPQPWQDLIYRVAMDAEQIAVGFWPGDDTLPEPAFFGYTYPKPLGIEDSKIQPAAAKWSVEKSEFLLPYETIRKNNPAGNILEFCDSIYRGGATLAGWDMITLEHKPPIEPIKSKS